MPKLIVKSGYTKDVKHFVNNLEYSGNKIASQQVVLTSGERINYDNCKVINLDEIGREDISSIYITFKDGKKVTVSTTAYEQKTSLQKNVTVERIVDVIPDNDNIKENQPRELQELNFFKYMSYVGERPGVVKDNGLGLFSLTGDIMPSVAEDIAQHDKFKRGWMHIISMDKADAQRTGFNTREAWRDLAISKAPEMAKAYNISLENLRFYGGFHLNTDNPHVHINFYSADSTEGFVKDMGKASKKVKSLFTNAIFKDDIEEIKEAIGIAKSEMSQALSKVLAMNEIKQEYVDRLQEIAKTLPLKGKMQYQFAPAPVKEKIKDFLRSLLQDEALEPLFQGYLKGYELYAQIYADNPEVIDRQKASAVETLINANDKNAWRRLHNEIMQAAVAIRNINNEAPDINYTNSDTVGYAPNVEMKSSKEQYSKSFHLDNKWNVNITEASANKYTNLKKLLYNTFSQSLLEDISKPAQMLKSLLDSENATPTSLLTAAINANEQIGITIGELAKELSDKPINNNGLILTEPQLLQALLNDEKHSPALSFSSWCKTAYNQMAASQVRKHCKRFNMVAGRHVIKTLNNNATVAEPQLCKLYHCNKHINDITETETEEQPLSAEDTATLKILSAQRKGLVESIYNYTLAEDKLIAKYTGMLEKYSGKYFKSDALEAISKIINDDIKNGNPFAAPGTYISSFAQGLPDYYIKQLATNECKEATTELYKVISNTIKEKIVVEPSFAQEMQQGYLDLSQGKEISIDSLSSQIFSINSDAALQRANWLATMKESIAKTVPADMQQHVVEALDKYSNTANRVLPFNNTIYHSVASLPETIATCVLKDNPVFEELRKTVNSVIVTSIRDGQRFNGDKAIPHLLKALHAASEEAAPDLKKQLADIIKDKPNVTAAIASLETDFIEKFSKISTLELPQELFEQIVLYDGFQSVSSTAEYYSGQFNMLDTFFREQRIQSAVLHMIKGIAQGLYSEMSSRETDLSHAESHLTGQGKLTHKQSSLSTRKTHERMNLNW